MAEVSKATLGHYFSLILAVLFCGLVLGQNTYCKTVYFNRVHGQDQPCGGGQSRAGCGMGRYAVPKTTNDLNILANMGAKDTANIIGAFVDTATGKASWLDGTDLPNEHPWWAEGQPKHTNTSSCVAVKAGENGSSSSSLYLVEPKEGSLFNFLCEMCAGVLFGRPLIWKCRQGIKPDKEERSCSELTLGNTCNLASESKECGPNSNNCEKCISHSSCTAGDFISRSHYVASCGMFECKSGLFGESCQLKCHCGGSPQKRNPCYLDSGLCYNMKCDEGWLGTYCNETECSKGLWGDRCQFYCACSHQRQCDVKTGKCPEWCFYGWEGLSCNQSQDCAPTSDCGKTCSCGDGVPCGADGQCPEDIFVVRRHDCDKPGFFGHGCVRPCLNKSCMSCDRDSGLLCRTVKPLPEQNGTSDASTKEAGEEDTSSVVTNVMLAGAATLGVAGLVGAVFAVTKSTGASAASRITALDVKSAAADTAGNVAKAHERFGKGGKKKKNQRDSGKIDDDDEEAVEEAEEEDDDEEEEEEEKDEEERVMEL